MSLILELCAQRTFCIHHDRHHPSKLVKWWSAGTSRCPGLVQRLQAAKRDRKLPQELAKMDRFDWLILVDLNYARRDWAKTSVLLELIAKRVTTPSVF